MSVRHEGCLCLLLVDVENREDEVAARHICRLEIGFQEHSAFQRVILVLCESLYSPLAC